MSLVRVQVGEPEKAKARSNAGLFYFLAGLLYKAPLLDFCGAGLNGPAQLSFDCAEGCAALRTSCKPDVRGNKCRKPFQPRIISAYRPLSYPGEDCPSPPPKSTLGAVLIAFSFSTVKLGLV